MFGLIIFCPRIRITSAAVWPRIADMQSASVSKTRGFVTRQAGNHSVSMPACRNSARAASDALLSVCSGTSAASTMRMVSGPDPCGKPGSRCACPSNGRTGRKESSSSLLYVSGHRLGPSIRHLARSGTSSIRLLSDSFYPAASERNGRVITSKVSQRGTPFSQKRARFSA